MKISTVGLQKADFHKEEFGAVNSCWEKMAKTEGKEASHSWSSDGEAKKNFVYLGEQHQAFRFLPRNEYTRRAAKKRWRLSQSEQGGESKIMAVGNRVESVGDSVEVDAPHMGFNPDPRASSLDTGVKGLYSRGAGREKMGGAYE